MGISWIRTGASGYVGVHAEIPGICPRMTENRASVKGLYYGRYTRLQWLQKDFPSELIAQRRSEAEAASTLVPAWALTWAIVQTPSIPLKKPY